MWALVARSAVDQFRSQAISPLSLLAALAMPFVLAFVVHGFAGGATDPARAVGIAGVGMLNAVVVDQLVALTSEKRWRTLTVAMASPQGMVRVVFGRLIGVGLQSLISLPGTLVFLVAIWGLVPGFDWLRWLVGGVCLAVTTTAAVGLLGYFLLRYPFSPGATNGLAGILIALSALLVPASALPDGVRPISWLVPSSHVMTWVGGGGTGQLLLALGEAAAAYLVIYLSLERVQWLARERGNLLEP